MPDVPEIRLHKAEPSSGLWRLGRGRAAPYWAYYWAGGLVLARFILDRPGTVAGKRVLDLGAGSGIVGIAAALSGAAQVLAAEIDPHGREALRLNAMLNGVAIEILPDDLLASAPPDVDLVLVGDLFYEARLARRVMSFLDTCLMRGLEVLVGDPFRAPLPERRLEPLAERLVRESGDAPKPAAVFAFRLFSSARA